jgi:hypothetical protein
METNSRTTSFFTAGETQLRYASMMNAGSLWMGPWLGAITAISIPFSLSRYPAMLDRNGIMISA